MALTDEEREALKNLAQALQEGDYDRANLLMSQLEGGEEMSAELDAQIEQITETSEHLADGNPDEELAEAIEELEPAAGEVAEAALEAGRPDLAEEVVMTTLSALADMAEAEQEIAETIEEVAAEIEDEEAQEVASDAADAADLAEEAVEETLVEAGIPAEVAEIATDPANGTEEFSEDIPPEPSHWLYRRRLGRRV